MPRDHERRFFLDGNGQLAERVKTNGVDVIVHYDDIPESDVTTVDGLRVTTPLRTVIDIAPEAGLEELQGIVEHCLSRGMFTREEALTRTGQPDLRARPGARMLRHVLLRDAETASGAVDAHDEA